jgi:hypothetical protein
VLFLYAYYLNTNYNLSTKFFKAGCPDNSSYGLGSSIVKENEARMSSIRSISLSLRFVIPLMIAMILLAVAVMPLVGILTLHWFKRDLSIRSRLIASTLQDPLAEDYEERYRARVVKNLKRKAQELGFELLAIQGTAITM